MTRRVICITLGVTLLAASAVLFLRTETGAAALGYMRSKVRGGYTVEERLALHGPDVAARLGPAFRAAGLAYPPRELTFLAFKDSRQLEVHARSASSEPWTRVITYPVIGSSGTLGPKLREGDLQVPEGLYRAEFLNANSRFHLSIRLDYPNAFDRAKAAQDGRTTLGSDIMIHGTSASVGCLAMGNEATEDLFVLAALAGKEQVAIIVAPTDFRVSAIAPEGTFPAWIEELYGAIRAELMKFASG